MKIVQHAKLICQSSSLLQTHMHMKMLMEIFLQHINADSKPRQSYDSPVIVLSLEEIAEHEQDEKNDGFVSHDYSLMKTFHSCGHTIQWVIEILNAQRSWVYEQNNSEITKKLLHVLHLLEAPLSLNESQENSFNDLVMDEIFLRRLYYHGIRFKDFVIFFPPYDWSTQLEEDRKDYETTQKQIQLKTQRHQDFIQKEFGGPWQPWFHSMVSGTINNSTYFCINDAVNMVLVPVLTEIVFTYLQGELTVDVNAATKQVEDEYGFYRLSYFTCEYLQTVWWSLTVDKALSELNPQLHPWHPFLEIQNNVLDQSLKEIGGQVHWNSLTQLLLQYLAMPDDEFQREYGSKWSGFTLRQKLTQLLCNTSVEWFNVKPWQQFVPTAPSVASVLCTNTTAITRNIDSAIPWIANVSIHNKRPAVQTKYLYENKLVKYDDSTSKDYYRMDVSRSSYSQGKYYYWSLMIDVSALRGRSQLTETHPLREVWTRWRKDMQLLSHDFSSHGGVVVMNPISTLCLYWLTLSNQELAHEISRSDHEMSETVDKHLVSKYVYAYRQNIIKYLDQVAD